LIKVFISEPEECIVPSSKVFNNVILACSDDFQPRKVGFFNGGTIE